MALRLIEVVLREEDGEDVRELLRECEVLEHRQIRLVGEKVMVRILLDAEHSETVLDLLEKRYIGKEGNRVVILPVEATLPRAQAEPEPEAAAPSKQSPLEEKSPERIGREELYEDIKNGAQLTRVYFAMVALSTMVAAIGLNHNSVAVIIGAMVIAPLLGPNVALSLGITLGDLSLLRSGLTTALAGVAAALALSVLVGMLLNVDPTLSELASRTRVGLGDIVLALASGCAGALAFTAGVGGFDRRHGRGGVVATAGDVGSPARRRASHLGHGRPLPVLGEPDFCEPGGSDDVLGSRHQTDEMVGEESGREGHAHLHCVVCGSVGGVGLHNSPGTKELSTV